MIIVWLIFCILAVLYLLVAVEYFITARTAFQPESRPSIAKALCFAAIWPLTILFDLDD